MQAKEELYKAAQEAMKRAYAPYSRFQVGAAILSENNNIYTGCNVENVSYPCGTCAEAGAISSMICNGDKNIKAILIIADSSQLIRPCGACLQRIAEFSTPETIIYLANKEGIKQSLLLPQLLPSIFTAEELKK